MSNRHYPDETFVHHMTNSSIRINPTKAKVAIDLLHALTTTIAPTTSGQGTRQAQNLAKQLGEHFQRFANQPRGTGWELVWARSLTPSADYLQRSRA